MHETFRPPVVIVRTDNQGLQRSTACGRFWVEDFLAVPAESNRYPTEIMTDWQLHTPGPDNQFAKYACGLVAGQRITLRKDLVIKNHSGLPTGEVCKAGEIWEVLPGIQSDPVLWLRQPGGKRHTWDDDVAEVSEWFEKLDGEG